VKSARISETARRSETSTSDPRENNEVGQSDRPHPAPSPEYHLFVLRRTFAAVGISEGPYVVEVPGQVSDHQRRTIAAAVIDQDC
jgi:hypothetical protein